MHQPRNLDPQASGLAPLTQPGPGQDIEHLRADMLASIDPEDMELIWQPMVDQVSRAQAAGESDYVLMRFRGQLRRLLRCLYERQVRRGGSPRIDFDPTTGRAGL